uniref:Uncharacterized protein n=1 Tax=Acrobeloides nanus TaxID=290746 RepID=A0A914DZB4_9BILA
MSVHRILTEDIGAKARKRVKAHGLEYLGGRGCSKPYQSINALKKSLVKAWNKIPQEVIDRAVDDFPKRLQKCIDAGGGHFENK